MNSITVPGKIFLMGEYSVIAGGKAIAAAISPGYRYSCVPENSFTFLHPESPAKKYCNQNGLTVTPRLDDSGFGPGFGSSTAELLAVANFARSSDTHSILNWYQGEFPEASGADLATQAEALRSGRGLHEVKNRTEIFPLEYSTSLTQVLIFQVPADQKILTHENLKSPRAAVTVGTANVFVDRLKACFISKSDKISDDWTVLTEWAEWLSALGLESTFAKRVRLKLLQVPGVLGAKGCGAGLNDVFIVATPAEFDRAQLLAVSESLNLRFLGTLAERLWKA